MTVDDSVMQKLWKLTNELTAQLVFNRNATLELKQQLADLQVRKHTFAVFCFGISIIGLERFFYFCFVAILWSQSG